MSLAVPALIEAGQGRALVFLHGVGGNKESFAAHLPVFAAQGWRAISWDNPGYGDSALPAVFDWPHLADALRDLLDALKIDRAVVVGHSMGGMVAQEFAARHPERLSALVLFGTSPAFGSKEGDFQKKFVGARLKPLDEGKSMTDVANAIVRGMMAPNPPPSAVAAAIDAMGRVPQATYRLAVQNLTTFERRDNLPKIAVPTLCLAAEYDTNATPAMMERMTAKIPGAAYRCMPGVGHLGNFENPALFDATLGDYLKILEA